MPKLKDIDAYVDICLTTLLEHVSFDDVEASDKELASLFTEVFLRPLTKEISIRFNSPYVSKINFRLIEGHAFSKISDKIMKKLSIPEGRFVVFNNFSGKKTNKRRVSFFDFDNNLICYRQEEGSIRSLLHVIRNSIAHGNVFACHNGILLFSMNKEGKINGLIKLSKLSDLLKLIDMLKNEAKIRGCD